MANLDEVPFCSEITRAEVLRGALPSEGRRIDRLIQSLQWVPVDEVISRRAGDLGAEYRQSHPGVDITDFLIAATALVLGAELATSNVRHFPMFAGLEPPY